MTMPPMVEKETKLSAKETAGDLGSEDFCRVVVLLLGNSDVSLMQKLSESRPNASIKCFLFLLASCYY